MEHIGGDIERAASLLASGEVVAFPTETVYGLGASIRQPASVRKVYEIKARPLTSALIVHVEGESALGRWGREVPEWARRCAEALWPGPFTLVVHAAPDLPSVVMGGGQTVALRAPNHPMGLALIRRLGELEGGVAGLPAPSANRHGALPPTDAKAARSGLDERVAYVLDGGPCSVGIESTLVDATGDAPRILREGATERETIERVSGLRILDDPGAAHTGAKTPPSEIPVRARVLPFDELSTIELRAGDGLVTRGTVPPTHQQRFGGAVHRALSEDLSEFGKTLYRALHELEAQCSRIHVQRAPEEGLGRAINARIQRIAASAGREA